MSIFDLFKKIPKEKIVPVVEPQPTTTISAPINAPIIPTWTPADEQELNEEIQRRLYQQEQEKREIFAKLPVEVREAVLERLKLHAVEKALYSISEHRVWESPKERTLLEKKGNLYGGCSLNFCNDTYLDRVPPYEDLMKIHADKATRDLMKKDR